ncbi:hypothetical protein ACOMHN_005612 [Nucella lapillus]
MFRELVDWVRPHISSTDTNLRRALEPGLKLAATLRYLATGDSYRTLSYTFWVGFSTLSKMIPEVCRAIYKVLGEEALPPVNEATWLAIAAGFEKRWNMPHTIGALDGKHIAIKKPRKSGSEYYNYKGFCSIPILAVVDSDYKFLWVETGGKGHMSDAQLFLESNVKARLDAGTMQGLPRPRPLTEHPDDTTDVPYFFVADDAFALKPYCMKPYGRRQLSDRETVFNYQLSRARRVVENTFGILANRFRCFLKTLEVKPDHVRDVIKAGLVLHNILRQRAPESANATDTEDGNHNIVPGMWRGQISWPDVDTPTSGRHDGDGKRVRENLADFFGSPQGIIPWQWQKAGVLDPSQ